MAQNFTLEDVTGAVRAAFAFTAILFCPGYLVGVSMNLFGFRERSALERTAWAVVLSFGTATIVAVLLGRVIAIAGVVVVLYGAVVATVAALSINRRGLRVAMDRYLWMLGVFAIVASVVVLGELVDLQRGRELQLSVTILDQSYRVAFTEALAHTGIPPTNPLYHPGTAAPLRYYYYWYTLCAICMKLAQVSARQALIASSIWSVVGLLAVIALFARYFLGIREGVRRFLLTAALLLGVTGADLLPTLFNLVVNHTFNGELEWWSGDQITSWFDSVLWVPNHMAAMICCLTAFLLLWRMEERCLARGEAIAAGLLAGTAAASAFGLSVYVAAGFAMLMTIWWLRLILRDRNWPMAGRTGAAAMFGLLLSIPFLREMTAAHSATEKGGLTGPTHLFGLSVRTMIDPSLVTRLPALARMEREHPLLLDQGVRLLLLLPGYALELGFYGLVLVLAIRERKRLGEPRRTALFLCVWGLILVSFVRSAVIRNNDFGYRAALLPCFFLLLLGVDKLLKWRDDPSKRTRKQTSRAQLETIAVTSSLLLGAAGTVFQALSLRLYAPFRTTMHARGFESLPQSAFAARMAYETASLPRDAIVQANPDMVSEYFYQANMLYAQRASATDAAEDCGAIFGGDPAPCVQIRTAFTPLFRGRPPNAAQAVATCHRFGVDYLAVAESDAAWADQEGWVWTLPLVTGSQSAVGTVGGGFRILNCRGAQGGLP